MAASLTAIAVAVVEHDDRFLVGQRPAGKPLAGYWEFPGGRVEEGESPQQAAIRECLEEAGVIVNVMGSYASKTHSYAHDTVELHFFACDLQQPSQAIRDPFRWVTRDKLRELQFPAANRELLHLLCGDTA